MSGFKEEKEVEEVLPESLKLLMEKLVEKTASDTSGTATRIYTFVSILSNFFSENFPEDFEGEDSGDLGVVWVGLSDLYQCLESLTASESGYESATIWGVAESIIDTVEEMFAEYSPSKVFKVELQGATFLIQHISEEDSAVLVAKMKAVARNFLFDLVSVEDITQEVYSEFDRHAVPESTTLLEISLSFAHSVLSNQQTDSAVVAVHTCYGIREVLKAFDMEFPGVEEDKLFGLLAEEILKLSSQHLYVQDVNAILLNKNLVLNYYTLDQVLGEIDSLVRKLFSTFKGNKSFQVTLSNWSAVVHGVADEWQAVTISQLEAIRNNRAYDLVDFVDVTEG
jgi:hypothetical protein